MKKNAWSLLAVGVAASILTACVAVPQHDAVKEVRVCAADHCGPAAHKYSSSQLLNGFQQLLLANKGEPVRICDSDPKNRDCASVGICQFVLGGFIPGNGCSTGIVFGDVAAGEHAGQLNLKADMPLSFIGTPLTCRTMTGTLSVDSEDVISAEFEPHYCNWMAIGNMSATFSFAVESLDVDHGTVGVYWSHAVQGNGVGRGSGYAVLEFPNSMPRGQNWLIGQQPLALLPSAEPGTPRSNP